MQKWDANQGVVPSSAVPLGESWECVKWKPGKSWAAVCKVQNVLECHQPLVSHCRSPSLTYVLPTSSRLYSSSTGTMRRSFAMTLILTWTECAILTKSSSLSDLHSLTPCPAYIRSICTRQLQVETIVLQNICVPKEIFFNLLTYVCQAGGAHCFVIITHLLSNFILSKHTAPRHMLALSHTPHTHTHRHTQSSLQLLSLHTDSQSWEHISFSSSQAPEMRSSLLKAIISAGWTTPEN